jgi:ribosomal protein L3
VDLENNLILIRGSVPGGKRGIVLIKKSKKS